MNRGNFFRRPAMVLAVKILEAQDVVDPVDRADRIAHETKP